MEHFIHRLQFATMGGFTKYEIYTGWGGSAGFILWDNVRDYPVPEGVQLLLLRKQAVLYTPPGVLSDSNRTPRTPIRLQSDS
jgi:hypothetical protein